MAHPKFLEHIVILCFERRFSKQNSVIRLKSNILPPQTFWAGYATEVKHAQEWLKRRCSNTNFPPASVPKTSAQYIHNTSSAPISSTASRYLELRVTPQRICTICYGSTTTTVGNTKNTTVCAGTQPVDISGGRGQHDCNLLFYRQTKKSFWRLQNVVENFLGGKFPGCFPPVRDSSHRNSPEK